MSNPTAFANSFGIYDARGLGMGGVGMSTGDLRTGHLYNPSLLAFHQGDEDRQKHGQHTLTAALGPVTGAAESAVDAVRDDFEARLNESVAQFNATPDQQAASNAANAAADLRQLLNEVNGQDMTGEAYVGYSVTEPAERAGGAFFIGLRTLGGGQARIAAEDLELLDSYIEALRSGDPTTANPDLVGEDGQLINPMDVLDSTASTRAIALAEVGVTFARQLLLFDQPVALGVSPKAVRARAFVDEWAAIDGEFGNSGGIDDDTYMNFDFGAAWQVGDEYRLAIAGKDVINKSFTTPDGQSFDLTGRYRAGMSYFRNDYTIGFELDLLPTESMTSDLKRQDLSLGAEYRFGNILDLRAGYRLDARNNFGDLLTAGLGLELGFLTLELSAATGSGDRSMALQVGILH